MCPKMLVSRDKQVKFRWPRCTKPRHLGQNVKMRFKVQKVPTHCTYKIFDFAHNNLNHIENAI